MKHLILSGLLLSTMFSLMAQDNVMMENQEFYQQKTLLFKDPRAVKKDLAALNKSYALSPIPDQVPKKMIRKFAIDSPFGTFMRETVSGSDRTLIQQGALPTRKSYRLVLCLTQVGFRIDL